MTKEQESTRGNKTGKGEEEVDLLREGGSTGGDYHERYLYDREEKIG